MNVGTVLVVNAGSSSMKLRLLDGADAVVASADLPAGGDVDAALATWRRPDAVGHRVVHGGTEFTAAVRVDAQVRQRLAELTSLAPLHQPATLAALDAVSRALPDVAAVACFDTAFHQTIPPAAATYAVPREWRERYGVRRYGFHGLSHAYCSARAAAMTGARRVVTCHLGAGASLAAVVDGRSVDTTMGFTPLEGLVMATRSGTVDPGLVLWLQQQHQLAADEVATALERHSGVLALAGSADMREVGRRAAADDPDARLALEVYIHRLVTSIGAMVAAAGGLDTLVFTGGVGEHSPAVRQHAADKLAHLGVAIDPARNHTSAGDHDAAGDDRDISADGAPVATLVIPAREDLQIARETRAALRT